MTTVATLTMPKRTLGNTGIEVPLICLGTMTWGEQNTKDDGFAQMTMALDAGVNFWDTAEVYAVPIRKETYGATESIIGEFFKANPGLRETIILASKISGPNPGFTWIREGKLGFDKASLTNALEGSLKRLQTDYIDLYQLHWPERSVNIFGQREYSHDPNRDAFDFLETLTAIAELIQQGKIRHWGLSNETPWGVMKYIALAEQHGLPKPVSVQNCYNILNRTLEVGLSEVLLRESISLLPYSPLAMGLLSGKYQQGKGPESGRLNLFGNYFSRYKSPLALEATQAYVDVAKRFGLTPAQLALAYVNHQPFVASTIIGATSVEQLKENLSSVEASLTKDMLDAINDIHDRIPNPCP